MLSFELRTSAKQEMAEITSRVEEAVAESGVVDGLCLVHIPHTTAGVTINENADPDVKRDMLLALDRMVPEDQGFRHSEGNSAAHAKASLMGFSVSVPVSSGKLALGTWQGIQFCEFDGPRRRSVWVSVLAGGQA
jgi:secondary thiamine-phosphate synthase enzyme